MNQLLNGKTAWVTGNSAGLGRAIGMALGLAGARVPVNFKNNQERAAQTLEAYRQAGITSALVQGDVTCADDVSRMYEQIKERLGPVDILVCNATAHHESLPIEQYEWDTYQEMVNFFIKSPYLLARAVLPHMKQQGWGRIVNITSEVFHDSVSPFSAYVAAKGGQIGWSRTMCRELAPFGITVNCVAPGWIPVERHANDPVEAKEAYLQSIPMGRWGTPEDVANAVAYFASPGAGFVTGQTLCVNGGKTPW